MLEQIVKKNIPFTGTFYSRGFDYKGRVSIQKPLIETLKQRQKVKNNSDINLFYKVNQESTLRYIEITDYFPEKEEINFKDYRHIKVDNDNRTLINSHDLFRAGIKKTAKNEKGDEIVFVGHNHKILIYKNQDFKQYIK